jgi:hypothetical protein
VNGLPNLSHRLFGPFWLVSPQVHSVGLNINTIVGYADSLLSYGNDIGTAQTYLYELSTQSPYNTAPQTAKIHNDLYQLFIGVADYQFDTSDAHRQVNDLLKWVSFLAAAASCSIHACSTGLRYSSEAGRGSFAFYTFWPVIWAVLIFVSLMPRSGCRVFFQVLVVLALIVMWFTWIVTGGLFAGTFRAVSVCDCVLA